jgi:hypothetical protein
MSCSAIFSTKTLPLLPRIADGGTTPATEEVIPMAQPDALDVALEQLVHSFGDLSVIANVIRPFSPDTGAVEASLCLRGEANSSLEGRKSYWQQMWVQRAVCKLLAVNVGSWPYLVKLRAQAPQRVNWKALLSGPMRFFLPSSGQKNGARPPNHPVSPNMDKSLGVGSFSDNVGSGWSYILV